jgi:hypothetical protein
LSKEKEAEILSYQGMKVDKNQASPRSVFDKLDGETDQEKIIFFLVKYCKVNTNRVVEIFKKPISRATIYRLLDEGF